MTSDVIDRSMAGALDGDMTTTSVNAPARVRYDRAIRVVMWLDAFWSTVAVLGSVAVIPAFVVLQPGSIARTVIAVVALTGGVLLAVCGALTFVLVAMRMRRGHYFLPAGLRLPLPRALRAWTNAAGGGEVRRSPAGGAPG